MPRLIADPTIFVAMPTLHRLALLATFALFITFVTGIAVKAGTPGVELTLLALSVYVTLLLLPLMFYRPAFSWFHPLAFGPIMILVGLLRRVGVFTFGLDSHVALPGWSSAQLNQLVAFDLFLHSVGLLSYYVGFFLMPVVTPPRFEFGEPTKLKTKVTGTVALCALVFALYIATKGGLDAHLISWRETRHVALAGDFYIILIIRSALPACLVWFALDPKAPTNGLFWGCVATALFINFFASGSRSIVFLHVLIGLAAWMLRERRLLLLTTVTAFVAAIGLFGALLELRKGGLGEEVAWDAFSVESLSSSAKDSFESLGSGESEFIHRSTEASGSLPIFALVPEEVDFLYGKSYLAAATVVVPRAIWPGKLSLTGGEVGRVFFGMTGGVPAGAVGEAYWNFYIPGVCMIYLLFGAFHQWIVKLFRQSMQNPSIILIYASTLLLFPAPETAGFIEFLQTFVPLVVMLRFMAKIRLRRMGKHGIARGLA